MNSEKELIITKETKIIFNLEDKNNVSIPPIKTDDSSIINRYYIMLIEQIINAQRYNIGILKNILNPIVFKLRDKDSSENIKINFNIDMLFKSTHNLVVNIWSILYLNNKVIKYLLLLLRGLEKEILEIFLKIKSSLNEGDNFNKQLKSIINLSIKLSYILTKDGYLYNLCHNRNYLASMKIKTITERKKIQIDIKLEINKINSIILEYTINFIVIIVIPYSIYSEE